MKRYISNFTILPDGTELINHITTLGDDGKLMSILPFDRELGNTRYVPTVLCVARAADCAQVEKVFKEASSRERFAELLCQGGMVAPQEGEKTLVLCLDFRTKIINEI